MKYLILATLLLLFPSIGYADNYIIKQKLVEFDNDYYQGVNGYYSTARSLRTREDVRKEQENEEIQLQILETLQRIESKLSTGDTPELPEVPQTPDVPEEPVPTESPDVSDLNLKVFNIFKKNCANCHNDTKSSKELALVGEENGEEFLYDLPLSDRVLIHHVTNNVNLDKTGHKLMPIGGPPLDNDSVETLRLWVVDKAKGEKEND